MEKNNLKVEFEPFIIYEAIVCIKYPNSEIINSSCMGVHFTPTNEVYLHVYEETDTKKLLKEGVKFSINFSDKIIDYTKAALLGHGSGASAQEIEPENFIEVDNIPVLQSAWLNVMCEVIKHGPDLILKPPCKRRERPNIRTKITNTKINSFPKIFQNRAMNLAIEALILSTRIPLYERFSEEYNESIKLYKKYKSEIEKWRDMDRFENAFQIMDNYLIDNGIKPQEIFDF